MKVKRIIEKEVTRCIDCPYYFSDMDGGQCREMEKKYGLYNAFVFPEGREGIHPKCPIK